jgi:hypothetical protein
MYDIDEFIDNMIMALPAELITYIVQKFIYLPYNKLIIQRQKLLKTIAHKQLFFISNIIFIDDNICIYTNNNQLIIHNNNINSHEYNNLSLYGLAQNISNTDNSDNINVIHTYNTLLLDEISNRLGSIQNNNISGFTNILQTNLSDMRNVVINTNHSNIDNISMYIMYI